MLKTSCDSDTKNHQLLTWRAWANVAWDGVRVVGLYFNFTTVKMWGPNKSTLKLNWSFMDLNKGDFSTVRQHTFLNAFADTDKEI